MVTFSALVVIANNSYTVNDIDQSVFVSMCARRYWIRQKPNIDLYNAAGMLAFLSLDKYR